MYFVDEILCIRTHWYQLLLIQPNKSTDDWGQTCWSSFSMTEMREDTQKNTGRSNFILIFPLLSFNIQKVYSHGALQCSLYSKLEQEKKMKTKTKKKKTRDGGRRKESWSWPCLTVPTREEQEEMGPRGKLFGMDFCNILDVLLKVKARKRH